MICGEVGTRFTVDHEVILTEPCVFLGNHKPEMEHSWEIREIQEEHRGIAPGTHRPVTS